MGMELGAMLKKWEDHFFYGNKIVSKSREQLSKKLTHSRKPANCN